jgi:hypothetical protein
MRQNKLWKKRLEKNRFLYIVSFAGSKAYERYLKKIATLWQFAKFTSFVDFCIS